MMWSIVAILMLHQSSAEQANPFDVSSVGAEDPWAEFQPIEPWEMDWATNSRHTPSPPPGFVLDKQPQIGGGPHELVVHWPSPATGPDYRRVYKSGAACMRARAALLSQQPCDKDRALCVLPPYAACVPVE